MLNDEGRTENLMKTLFNSGDIEDKFEKIIETCRKNKLKYSDPEFYPHIAIPEYDKEILQNHEWRRIETQYSINIFDNISPESIEQGTLGDCYFVVSLIYAAQKEENVKYLFHPKSSLEYGCVLVYFWFLGERIPVIIDTLIAYNDRASKVPLFSHPKDNNSSCWFSLVEKAFAKACGGYKFIVSGKSHFGVHVLFDYFSVAHSELDYLINEKTIEKKDNIDRAEEIFQIMMELKRKNAIIGSYIYKDNFPNKSQAEIEQKSGLITDHAYYVLDIREAEDKRFIKLRNPWGKFGWKGEYSSKSDKWTNSLKNELNYSNNHDGSFWMLYKDFLSYFTSIGYCLEKEKEWKEMNVYGKIEGYLDGRSPFSNSKNTGCIPQWTIKFTKKTIVRLTFNIAGPISYHGLYICKNHGLKVDLIKESIEFRHSTSNTFVNGIEYEVNDFSEPFTFFLTRHESRESPCYYRILIESPDKEFTVNKFDDDFLNKNLYCVSETGIFNSIDYDQWNPFQSKPLSTCKQWYIKFPQLKKNEKTELRIRFFKTISEGPLFLFIAKTNEKISYAYKQMEYYNLIAYSVSDYEEFRIPINNKENLENQKKNNKQNEPLCQYVISVYRNKQNDINKFKFILMSKSKFEFGLMPDPDPIKHCGYTIKGSLQPGINDGKIPYWTTVRDLKQWCLIFKKSPTNLFVDFYLKNATSLHSVYLEIRNVTGQKMGQFHRRYVHFDFDIQPNCSHNRKMWKIEDASKPYALCVCRDSSSKESEYEIHIFGSHEFQMFEINDSGIGKSASRYECEESNEYFQEQFEFEDVKLIEQPLNFTPKKSETTFSEEDLLSISKPIENHDEKQKKKSKEKNKNKEDTSQIRKQNLSEHSSSKSNLFHTKLKVDNSNENDNQDSLNNKPKQQVHDEVELISNNINLNKPEKKEESAKSHTKCCLLI